MTRAKTIRTASIAVLVLGFSFPAVLARPSSQSLDNEMRRLDQTASQLRKDYRSELNRNRSKASPASRVLLDSMQNFDRSVSQARNAVQANRYRQAQQFLATSRNAMQVMKRSSTRSAASPSIRNGINRADQMLTRAQFRVTERVNTSPILNAGRSVFRFGNR